jgi:GT2 family glycosyltransferase
MTTEVPYEKSHRALQVDVHVSIVTHRNRELARRCLASLAPACSGITRRVTVVDNSPGDGTAEMIARHFPDVELIRNAAPLGFAANHNKIFETVVEDESARYVLALNHDTELEPGSIARLVEFCDARPDLGAAGPLVLGTDMRPQTSQFAFPTLRNELRYELGLSRGAPIVNGGYWLSGCCILIRTAAALEIGLWDERFFLFYEDVDLGKRLVRAGWRVARCDAARIVHVGHASISLPQESAGAARQMLKSRYLYFSKHHGPARALLVMQLVRAALLARCAKAFVAGLLTPDAGERTHGAALWQLVRYCPNRSPDHAADPAAGTR